MINGWPIGDLTVVKLSVNYVFVGIHVVQLVRIFCIISIYNRVIKFPGYSE